jgi:hypothetical protein
VAASGLTMPVTYSFHCHDIFFLFIDIEILLLHACFGAIGKCNVEYLCWQCCLHDCSWCL